MRFSRTEILLNLLFWAFFTWIFVFSNTTMDIVDIRIVDGKQEKTLVRNHLKLYTFLVAQTIAILFFYAELYFVYRLKKPRAVRGFVLKSILLFLGMFIFQLIATYLVYAYQDKISELKEVKDLNVLVIMNIFYIAVGACYGFTKKWVLNEQDKQKLELVKNQAELNLLKQQLQPHFLFNTLNNLLSMVNQTDNPKLATSIDKLSNLLRYVVYEPKDEKVSVSQEIAFVENFAELHLLRYEEHEVDFKISIVGSFDGQPIEPGILLCYVENAFKHGVQPEEKSFIYIDFDLSKQDEITFTIENSIPKIPFTYESGGFGIQSNQERLSLLYPDKHSINHVENTTFKVKLIINTDD